MAVTIVTNNVPRYVRAGHEIPKNVWDEHFAFYLGEYAESNEEMYGARFIQYRGDWYDLNDGFMRVSADGELAKAGFHGAMSDTYFSGIAVKYCKTDYHEMDPEVVVIARFAFLD